MVRTALLGCLLALYPTAGFSADADPPTPRPCEDGDCAPNCFPYGGDNMPCVGVPSGTCGGVTGSSVTSGGGVNCKFTCEYSTTYQDPPTSPPSGQLPDDSYIIKLCTGSGDYFPANGQFCKRSRIPGNTCAATRTQTSAVKSVYVSKAQAAGKTPAQACADKCDQTCAANPPTVGPAPLYEVTCCGRAPAPSPDPEVRGGVCPTDPTKTKFVCTQGTLDPSDDTSVCCPISLDSDPSDVVDCSTFPPTCKSGDPSPSPNPSVSP